MAKEIEWLTLPDAAERLGVPVTHVYEMLRERKLLAVRRGEHETLQFPGPMLVELDGQVQPLPTLRGTLTMLADARLGDDEAMEWLLTDSAELGQTPLAALVDGRRAPVRRAAQTLF